MGRKLLWACLLDNAVILVLVPVEAQLTDPLKIIGVGAAHLAQLLNHIPSMHLNGDESHNLQPVTKQAQVWIMTPQSLSLPH